MCELRTQDWPRGLHDLTRGDCQMEDNGPLLSGDPDSEEAGTAGATEA